MCPNEIFGIRNIVLLITFVIVIRNIELSELDKL